jgi:IS5 family transposase
LVFERWVYDPYFQHFTGEEFFQHEFPHERSDLSHWRKRLGGKLELLLAESLRVAHESGALRTKDLARVTLDTTVQPKDITFPTDAKLLHAAIKGLTRLARKRGVRLRQSLCAHRQARRHDGRALCPCQTVQPPPSTAAHFAHPPRQAHSRHPAQDRKQRGTRGGIRLATLTCRSDPLAAAAPARRSAIEAVIGHMKAQGHLGRCYLKGRAGDAAAEDPTFLA